MVSIKDVCHALAVVGLILSLTVAGYSADQAVQPGSKEQQAQEAAE